MKACPYICISKYISVSQLKGKLIVICMIEIRDQVKLIVIEWKNTKAIQWQSDYVIIIMEN